MLAGAATTLKNVAQALPLDVSEVEFGRERQPTDRAAVPNVRTESDSRIRAAIDKLARAESEDHRVTAVVASICECVSAMDRIQSSVLKSGRQAVGLNLSVAAPIRRPWGATPLCIDLYVDLASLERVAWLVEFTAADGEYTCAASSYAVEQYGSRTLRETSDTITRDLSDALYLLAVAPGNFSDPSLDIDSAIYQ